MISAVVSSNFAKFWVLSVFNFLLSYAFASLITSATDFLGSCNLLFFKSWKRMVCLKFWKYLLQKMQCILTFQFCVISGNRSCGDRPHTPSSELRSNLWNGFIFDQRFLCFGSTHFHMLDFLIFAHFWVFLFGCHIVTLMGQPNWRWKFAWHFMNNARLWLAMSNNFTFLTSRIDKHWF